MKRSSPEPSKTSRVVEAHQRRALEPNTRSITSAGTASPTGGPGLFHAPGIPPAVAQRLGLSVEVVKKVRDYGFEANEQLISLDADLKRAQLELEKTLAQPTPEENAVLAKVELVGRAELAVRKNRVVLMLRIRKLLGPETWDRLQAEFPGPNLLLMGPPMGGGQRREVRIIKKGDATEVTEINE
jgi:hypothetical protein